MRILHVTDCYLPRLGGIELHVRDLVTRQRLDGHDARVVTLTPAGPGAAPDPAWVVRVAETEPTLRQAAGVLRRLLGEGAGPDVVHVHASVFSPFATLAARETSVRGLPTVVTVHSMWTGLGPLPAMAGGLLGLRRWPVVWSAVSERAAEPLRTLLGAGADVRVLPNAVDPATWRTGVPTYAELLPPGAPRTVVSVMRLTRVKRTLPLARILHDVRRRVPAGVPLRAVVVGEGPQRPALERYLRRHRLADWVELPGRLERTAIRAELQRASVFLAPAERESFGIAPLEARAVGLPVVASSRSGVGEYVRHGAHGLLGADDGELAGHVATLLTDDRLRTRIAAHNRTVPTTHDWPAACRHALDLYDLAALRTGRRTSEAGR